jgi:hypothetical protein
MGGGNWNVGTYQAASATRKATGTATFDYSDRVTSGRAPQVVHDLLRPDQTAGPSSPFAGQVMREVCVTDEHPDPTAIQIWLDVTGSNFQAAKIVHSKLPRLQAYLRDGHFCNDPQINVGAIGDANSDQFPLQWGQFESDNRLDDQIAAIILEGNGGGQRHETYELGAYLSARHVNLEPYHLLGKKGFVFFTGDEMPYQTIKRDYSRGHWGSGGHSLTSLTGDDVAEDIDAAAIFAELQVQNHVFFLFQQQGAYRAESIVPAWEKVLGAEQIIMLDDPALYVEVIASIIARFEGDLDAAATSTALVKAGASASEAASASRALVRLGAQVSKRDRVATTSGTLTTGGPGADRL